MFPRFRHCSRANWRRKLWNDGAEIWDGWIYNSGDWDRLLIQCLREFLEAVEIEQSIEASAEEVVNVIQIQAIPRDSPNHPAVACEFAPCCRKIGIPVTESATLRGC